MGKRLKDLTKNNTKCMIKVGGVTLIERLLHQLERYDLDRVVIVAGYKGKELIEYVKSLDIQTPVEFLENPIFDKTNNIYSLYLAKNKLIEEDTLLFESDLIVENAAIDVIVNDPRPTLALVDKYESWMDGTCVRLNESDEIAEFISGGKLRFDETVDYYKTVNIYKFGKNFSATCYVPFLEAYCSALGNNEYYEQVLKVIALAGDSELKAVKLSGQAWYEIDDIQDLDIAESIFNKDRTELIQARCGGYWRYPKLLDFSSLANSFYPPDRMVEELKASFDTLLRQNPSALRVNNLLASKMFGVKQEYICIGNGASELIKSLKLGSHIGVVFPSVDGAPDCLDKNFLVTFEPQNNSFSYSADDLMNFFGDRQINSLVLTNPDNPSGNYIPHGDLLRLATWAEERNITLVVDESFADFADEHETLIKNELLERFPRLVVVKSVSKCYGVPGLKLGIVVGNPDLISSIKESAVIRNINSIAEFYLQIEEKYKGDYEAALKLLRTERTRFFRRLSAIQGVQVIPSQANFFMLRLNKPVAEIVDKLLARQILVKDIALSNEQLLRIAVKSPLENDKLVETLTDFMR